jgi:alkane 1-monooxygenase
VTTTDLPAGAPEPTEPGASTESAASTAASTAATEPAVRWQDPKRRAWMYGLAVPLLPFGGGLVAWLTGWTFFWWMGPLWIFVIIPLLDTLAGTDASNPPAWAVPQLESDRYYRWCVYLYIPLQLVGFLWGASVIAGGSLSPVSQLGLALSVGTVAGVGINTAHELGHKRERVERRLSKVALAQSGYGHFYVEHNRGHHANVSTPEDPASARFGESFWVFLPRTVVGSLRSAWTLASGAQRRKDQRVWSLRNDVLNAWALSVVLFGVAIALFGPVVLPYVAVQAVFGFSLLEVVNYIEHYGLLRQRVANGRYERCRPEHSWNSNNIVSNLVLYHLERHSDHHANPTRRYQSLRHFDEAPQLPSGYALMIGLAYFPPLWRRVMDHRVLAHYDGDITRANIHPPARSRVLARYAVDG